MENLLHVILFVYVCCITNYTYGHVSGCGDLSNLDGVLSIINCSEWSPDLLLGSTTLSTIIIDCTFEATQLIIRRLLEARSSGGVEKRLLLPVYNIISTHGIATNTTFDVDMSAIHFVDIIRRNGNWAPTKTDDIICPWKTYNTGVNSSYVISMKEGIRDWHVVGHYRDKYIGNPSFVRQKFVNFEGMKLLITHELYKPFTMIKNGLYYGFCIDLLEYLATQLNFTYKLVYSIDRKFGIRTSDGSWNGMVGMMERKEVDMIMAGLTITASRETVVDFTLPFYEEHLTVLAQGEIIETEISWLYLFNPLQLPILLAAAGSLLFCNLMVYIYEQLSVFILHNYGKGPDSQSFLTLKETTWLFVTTYARQDAQRLPSSSSARFTLGAFWLVPLFIGWLYSANLTASLVTTEIRAPFATLEDLANDTEYIILLNSGGVNRLLLENSKSGVYAALWNKILKTKQTSLMADTDVAMKRMFDVSYKQKFAVLGDKTILTTALYKDYADRCDWVFIQETFFPAGLAIALPDGSPYKDVFNKGVISALSSGLTLKYQKKNFFKSTCKDIAQGARQKFSALTLSHVKTILVMLCGGLLLSVVSFCFEYTAIAKRIPYVSHTGVV